MRFKTMQWLFPIAVTIHNSEEAVFMPRWIAAHANRLPWHPGHTKIWCGLLLLTIAAFAITYLSARKNKQSVWAYLLFGYMSAMLANVLIPHIPATLIFREYTPGVVSAAFVNLPVMSILLYLAVSEDWVSGLKAALYAVLVPVVMGLSILATLVLP